MSALDNGPSNNRSRSTHSGSRPTPEQREILEFMAPAMGEGLTLAHDVAMGCGFPPRSAGQKLRALERRGWVRRAIAKNRASMRSDHLYGWEVTDEGWKTLVTP